MAKLFFTLLLAVISVCTQGQNVGIGTTEPKASAALEIASSNKGLLIPRTSTAGRTAIAAPAKGLMVYDTTHAAFFYYDGGTWRPLYEKNYDSAAIDYSNVNGASINLPTSVSGAGTVGTGNSGFIYDNGGPADNYSANNFSYCQITFNDSTLQIKITVEEMNAENSYDSLFIIQFNGTAYADTIATFTGTQTGTVDATNHVHIYFKANNINQFAGFKIRWGRLQNSGASQTDAPLYGWHFNNAKLAAMGGVPRNKNWHTDSVGVGSLSYGIGVKAKGKQSFAVGNNTAAIGDYSISMGRYAQANESFSIALGQSTKAIGYNSTAIGYSTEANGTISTAMGASTRANGYASLVAGMNNDPILTSQTTVTSATPLFIIGNGDHSSALSNAMVVLKNGNVAIGDNGSPVNRLHITGGTDLDLTDNSGFMTLGSVGGTNMVLDNNEIQARNNGAANNLFIQSLGGDVRLANNATGQVMIGTGSPDQRLSVNGNASKVGGGSWAGYSDLRLKQNVLPYTDGLVALLKIKPVWYNYNQLSGYDVTKKYVGVLAQDLKEVSPYMVTESATKKAADGSGYLSVDNSAMTYMLINAIKEQQAIIEALKKRIEVLEKK